MKALVSTCLSFPSLACSSLELFRAHEASIRMPPLTIIENLDVLEDFHSCIGSSPIVSPIETFPFDQGEETFCHGIIVTIPSPTHTTGDPLFPENPLEVGTGILTASI